MVALAKSTGLEEGKMNTIIKKLAVLCFLAVMLAACGGLQGAALKPSEVFPLRNTDPTVGLIYNHGTTGLNLWIFDQAGVLVTKDNPIFIAPADAIASRLAVNQWRTPAVYVRQLPIGGYRIVYVPFYFELRWFPPRRHRVDLPRGEEWVGVGRDPFAVYDRWTGRHWGWVLDLNGGDMPRGDTSPNINLHIWCC